MALEIFVAFICAWCIFGACHAARRFDMQVQIPKAKRYLIVLCLEGPLVWVAVPLFNLVAYCVDLFMVKVCPLFKKFEDWYQEK